MACIFYEMPCVFFASRFGKKNNVFCLLIRQSFVIFVKMKTADGTFGYGHCRDMEDSYSAWKQAEIDIYIYTFTERLGIEN